MPADETKRILVAQERLQEISIDDLHTKTVKNNCMDGVQLFLDSVYQLSTPFKDIPQPRCTMIAIFESSVPPYLLHFDTRKIGIGSSRMDTSPRSGNARAR